MNEMTAAEERRALALRLAISSMPEGVSDPTPDRGQAIIVRAVQFEAFIKGGEKAPQT